MSAPSIHEKIREAKRAVIERIELIHKDFAAITRMRRDKRTPEEIRSSFYKYFPYLEPLSHLDDYKLSQPREKEIVSDALSKAWIVEKALESILNFSAKASLLEAVFTMMGGKAFQEEDIEKIEYIKLKLRYLSLEEGNEGSLSQPMKIFLLQNLATMQKGIGLPNQESVDKFEELLKDLSQYLDHDRSLAAQDLGFLSKKYEGRGVPGVNYSEISTDTETELATEEEMDIESEESVEEDISEEVIEIETNPAAKTQAEPDQDLDAPTTKRGRFEPEKPEASIQLNSATSPVQKSGSNQVNI